jgi:methyl-accepting chemotaxis protein
MSKTINQLKQLEAQRTQKYTTALSKEATTATPQATRAHKHWLNWKFTLLFAVIILPFFALNLKLFMRVKSYGLKNGETISKLNTIEGLMNDSARQMKALTSDIGQISTGLESVNIKTQDNNNIINQLDKQSDAQKVAIENLTKAKNTLFNRVNSLEIEINKKNSQTPEQ